MATWNQWENALQKAGQNKSIQNAASTTDVYEKILALGLSTVKWESFSPKNPSDLLQLQEKIRVFVNQFSPCLFIFEPSDRERTPQLTKGYLFGVKSFSEVEKWIANNPSVLLDYSYLVTTQITNPGNGFVGSVFSDGAGNIVCESLHKPGVSNQRELSQPKESLHGFLDFFASHEFELLSHHGKFLSPYHIRMVIREYAHLPGYFEFVFGKQLDQTGLFTTGFLPLGPVTFPKELWEHEFHALSQRFTD